MKGMDEFDLRLAVRSCAQKVHVYVNTQNIALMEKYGPCFMDWRGTH